MPIKINCIYNDRGAWCNNKKIKRSLLGLGARCCTEFPYSSSGCKIKEEYPRPTLMPPVPPKLRALIRIIIEDAPVV